jgi:hypothetical protein
MNIESQSKLSESENVIAGVVGAFLFSLVGGLAWFLFYLIGILRLFPA